MVSVFVEAVTISITISMVSSRSEEILEKCRSLMREAMNRCRKVVVVELFPRYDVEFVFSSRMLGICRRIQGI